ncbi:ABC transporter permease [Leucobacter tardus]|uniref:ABC transporter permease n=1 Tax=Leucobacter tardus TaxID=501483 RepID=A0A939QGE6_9MICO|nr:ABC transporter permease [Leucobacter tardus]MBO2990753.1 ABC transporter permease [Leucobacter tardus]
MDSDVVLRTAVAVAILIAIATAVMSSLRIPAPWAPAVAIARAAVQLAALSLILTGIIASPLWIAVALLVMCVAAALVSAQRSGEPMRDAPLMLLAIGGGAAIACSIVFATGALEFSSRYVLALGAMTVGNAMSIATLTARNVRRQTHDHWSEVEGWLALGATPRRSTLELTRRSIAESLIPSIDQSKTTGLVVLPGAFVGAIFGGLSPLEAGRFQLIVLAAILAAGAVTAAVVALRRGSMHQKPRVLER